MTRNEGLQKKRWKMSRRVPFDPYYKWLGIPSSEQPANYYRLLSLDAFESDPEIITGAVERQVAFLQLQKNGPYAAEANRLLGEIERARLTLLNAQKRAAYDRQLRADLQQSSVSQTAAQKTTVPNVAGAQPTASKSGIIPPPPSVSKSGSSGIGKRIPVASAIPPVASTLSAPVASADATQNVGEPAKLARGRSKPASPDSPKGLVPPVVKATAAASPQIRTAEPTSVLVFAGEKTGKKPHFGKGKSLTPEERREQKRRRLLIGWGAFFSFLLLFLWIGFSGSQAGRNSVNTAKLTQPKPTPAPDSVPAVAEEKADAEEPLPEESEPEPAPPSEPAPPPEPPAPPTPAPRVAGERMVQTVNGIEYAFRWCPPGTFQMGYTPEDWANDGDHPNPYGEFPHEVTLTKGFWILETEVTQCMWRSLMPSDPSAYQHPNRPANQMRWEECLQFCQQLSTRLEGGFTVTLPTEAQWEYAAMAGTNEIRPADVNAFSWNSTNSDGRCHVVGQKAPNAWGLFDIFGNVNEYCLDESAAYPHEAVTDPPPAVGETGVHILRGGCWFFRPERSSAKNRSMIDADKGASASGFRVILLENE